MIQSSSTFIVICTERVKNKKSISHSCYLTPVGHKKTSLLWILRGVTLENDVIVDVLSDIQIICACKWLAFTMSVQDWFNAFLGWFLALHLERAEEKCWPWTSYRVNNLYHFHVNIPPKCQNWRKNYNWSQRVTKDRLTLAVPESTAFIQSLWAQCTEESCWPSPFFFSPANYLF